MLSGRKVRHGSCPALAAVLWLAVSSIGAAEHAGVLAALDSIRTEELRQHVDVLASDQYEGRQAGSSGGQAAGGYLVELLKENGIQTAGDSESYFQTFGNGYRNILGLIEGSDPKLNNQYVLVGAHYDHVGYGTNRNSFGPIGYIHNGADDNASGSSGLAEVMQAFKTLPTPPKRSVLFAWWDAEEMGMLGSKHWTGNPTVPLEDLVCIFNMDMIGRLRNDRLEIYGVRTSPGLRQLVSRENVPPQLTLDFIWESKANSDHFPFFRKEIPYVMLHTGVHDDYHRPRDDAELINSAGMRSVTQLMFRVVLEIADRDERPEFRSASRYDSDATRQQLERPLPAAPPRLGLSWAPDDTEPGLSIRSVTIGSAADQAGIRAGDRILQFDGHPITDSRRFPMMVLAATGPTEVLIQRTGEAEPRPLQVNLLGEPVRVGISWREDPAEPGSMILTRVTTGSAAFLAGLLPGDRVYELGGKRFSDATEFRDLLTADVDRIEMLIERRGRLSAVYLDLPARAPTLHVQPAEEEPAVAS